MTVPQHLDAVAPHARQAHAWSPPPRGRRFRASVAVVGAGQAGLVVARELLKEGHSVTVIEAGPGIGGTWVVSPQLEGDPLGLDRSKGRVHSSMYPGLRTNLPRQLMSYLDFPFVPEAMGGASHDPRIYPLHSEVLAYVEAYADAHDLRRLVELNTEVARIDALPLDTGDQADGAGAGDGPGAGGAERPPWGQRWRVLTRPAGGGEGAEGEVVREFDSVAVCVGHHSDPILPEIPGLREWPGPQLHVHSFRGGQRFKGQRVMVVGASFSGEEIARHVADHADHVFHSARSWPSNGPPAGRSARGAGGAPDAPFEGRANITRVPIATELRADGTIVLADGRVLEGIDGVVWCTGYKYSFPFMEHLGLVDTSDHHVRPLYLHMFPPTAAPSLALIGLSWRAIRPQQFQLQGQLLARVLSGAAAPLPPADELLRAAEADLLALDAAGIPRRYAHCMASFMPQEEWAYNAALVAAARPPPGADAAADGEAVGGPAKGRDGVLAPPAWLIGLAKASSSVILERPDSFRDDFIPAVVAALEAADKGCDELIRSGVVPASALVRAPLAKVVDAGAVGAAAH